MRSRNTLRLSAVVVLCFLTGIGTSYLSDLPDRTKIVSSVEKLNQSYKERDQAAMERVLAQEVHAESVFGRSLHPRDEFARNAIANSPEIRSIELSDISVTIRNGFSIVDLESTKTTIMSNGSERITRFDETFYLAREGGEWRIRAITILPKSEEIDFDEFCRRFRALLINRITF